MNHLLPPSLDDADPRLVAALRYLGSNFGPLGVAVVAAGLTDPNVLLAAIETHTQKQRDADRVFTSDGFTMTFPLEDLSAEVAGLFIGVDPLPGETAVELVQRASANLHEKAPPT